MSKILIIDDDINALKLLGYTLRKAGFEILVAQNGFEGLEKAEEAIPDLIVSDLMMPKMDGYEVTRRVRSNPAIKHIPIIMLTAKSQVHDKVAGFEAGVNDYVTKPVMPVELIARIKAHLSHPTPSSGTPKTKAKIIGFLGVKGGTGVSTLLINMGMALQQKNKVVLIDFQTSAGTISQQLGLSSNNNLLALLKKPVNAINPETLSRVFIKHKSGLVLLPPPHGVYARHQPIEPAQARQILTLIDSMADHILVDLGCTLNKTAEATLKLCDQICLVTEPNLLSLDLTKRVIQYITDLGLGNQLGVVLVSRSRSGHNFTLDQIKAALKSNVWGIIPPAPELAYQALQSKTPMVILQPNNMTTQQIQHVVSIIT